MIVTHLVSDTVPYSFLQGKGLFHIRSNEQSVCVPLPLRGGVSTALLLVCRCVLELATGWDDLFSDCEDAIMVAIDGRSSSLSSKSISSGIPLRFAMNDDATCAEGL